MGKDVLVILMVAFGLLAIVMFVLFFVYLRRYYNSKHINDDYKKDLDNNKDFLDGNELNNNYKNKQVEENNVEKNNYNKEEHNDKKKKFYFYRKNKYNNYNHNNFNHNKNDNNHENINKEQNDDVEFIPLKKQ